MDLWLFFTHWFIVHNSLRVAEKWFCGGSRSDITIYRCTVKIALKSFNADGLKVLRGCLLHLLPTSLLWRLPCKKKRKKKKDLMVCASLRMISPIHRWFEPEEHRAEMCAPLSIAGGLSRLRASLGFMAGEEVT